MNVVDTALPPLTRKTLAADAAMVDMVLRTLPKVAAEIAAPLARADKITMVAGADGTIGASRLTSTLCVRLGSVDFFKLTLCAFRRGVGDYGQVASDHQGNDGRRHVAGVWPCVHRTAAREPLESVLIGAPVCFNIRSSR
jgi:hypothetical protein